MNEELRKKRLQYLCDNIPKMPPAFITKDADEFLKLYLLLEKNLTNALEKENDITSYTFIKHFETNYKHRLALICGLFHNEKTLDEILSMIRKMVPRVMHRYADPDDLTANLIERNNSQHLDARCRYLAKEIQKTIGNIIDQRTFDRCNYLKEIEDNA